jgi:hypothetical protein
MIDLINLERAARAATAGPWRAQYGDFYFTTLDVRRAAEFSDMLAQEEPHRKKDDEKKDLTLLHHINLNSFID